MRWRQAVLMSIMVPPIEAELARLVHGADHQTQLDRQEFDFDQLTLLDGTFTINVWIQDAGGGVIHARLEPATTFTIVSSGRATGFVRLPLRIELNSLTQSGSAVSAAG